MWYILLLLPFFLTTHQGHEFHVALGRMAVEGNQVVLQMRLFQDDLELGLQGYYEDEEIRLKVDAVTDSLFTLYVNEKFIIKHGEEVLTGVVATSGEDLLYGYPVWWFSLTYEASASIEGLEIDNQVLMEVFEDQQNVLRITHYPADEEKMYYMVRGDSEIKVEF